MRTYSFTPMALIFLGAYSESCSENSLFPKIRGQIAEVPALPCAGDALGSGSHCSRGTCSRCRQIFAWRDVVLLEKAPLIALALLCLLAQAR